MPCRALCSKMNCLKLLAFGAQLCFTFDEHNAFVGYQLGPCVAILCLLLKGFYDI